jgi:transcriptional regulator with XRE-family HTH domain
MVSNTAKARAGRSRAGQVDAVDAHVGSRLRLRRTILGMTEESLGAAIGASVQQIQNYESGAERIGAKRLFDFSELLKVPVSFFFDDTDPMITTAFRGIKQPSIQP